MTFIEKHLILHKKSNPTPLCLCPLTNKIIKSSVTLKKICKLMFLFKSTLVSQCVFSQKKPRPTR